MKALVLDGDFDPRPDYPVSETEKQTRDRAPRQQCLAEHPA